MLKGAGVAVVALAALAALAWLVSLLWSDRVISVRAIASTVLGVLGGMLFERVMRVKWPSWKRDVALVVSAFAGAAVAWIHARRLDRVYLRAGSRTQFTRGDQ
jgi:hypothetical protein